MDDCAHVLPWHNVSVFHGQSVRLRRPRPWFAAFMLALLAVLLPCQDSKGGSSTARADGITAINRTKSFVALAWVSHVADSPRSIAAIARRFAWQKAQEDATTPQESTSPATNVQLDELSPEALRERGRLIYEKQCAECHGVQGEGVEYAFSEPLIGDSTIGELSDLIGDTMPEGEPELCEGDEARAVASYIHYAFYSEAARLRNRPPQLTLTRLTADQMRQSLSDLYAHFYGIAGMDDAHGLQGEYYSGDRQAKENRKIERVDRVIDFDFEHAGPGAEITADEFSIRWRGGLRIDETGRYELIVHSSCSFVLHFGRDGRVLINNHVQSGDKTEFRRTLHLTAGRVYPVRIDFRQRKRKTEQPPARISLAWVPPHGTEQIVPSYHLEPGWKPPVFALQANLPPDDRSYGYERGIAVSRQWDDATTTAAVEFAQVAIDELWPHYQQKHKISEEGRRDGLKAFLSEFVQLAFRGPLDEPTRELYIEEQISATEDDAEAIRRVVLIALKSPRFLYPAADASRKVSQRVANRLALTLYDSLPADPWLLALIEKDALHTEPQVREAAQRMLSDQRARAKTRQMLHEWLNLDHVQQLSKDESEFAGFDQALAGDLRASLDAFLDDVVWSEASDYRQLFLADWSYSTRRIVDFYGDDWKAEFADHDFLCRTSDGLAKRHGVLTHPYLMSGLAYHDATSPIHRGVFLTRYMLGRTIRPPNQAFTPLSPDLHPELTTRERVALQTSSEGCQVCHAKINPLGFTLENYDAAGRFREQEGDRIIDSSGEYVDRVDQRIELNGAAELAEYLANSEEAQRAFIRRAFQHFVKQPPAAYHAGVMDQLHQAFVASDYNVRKLLVEIAVIAANERNLLSTASIED